MSQPYATQPLTEQEYLDWERAAEERHEYFAGEIFAMAGSTLQHAQITANLLRELGTRLRQGPCVPFSSDLRVKVEATGLYTYPDVSVVCGPPQLTDAHQDTLTNPTLLVEVLSDSTEGYDRGTKFAHYRQISSLREYLLVSQREPRLELFSRGADGQWILTEAAGMENSLLIPALNIVVPLAEVYASVRFAPVPFRPNPAAG